MNEHDGKSRKEADDEMTGVVTDLLRCSLYDGPGVRTTVFLKGCTLMCAWCHNPEGIRPGIQLRYFKEKCTGCGRCAAVCPSGAHFLDGNGTHRVDFAACAVCGRCVGACLTGALVLAGTRMTAEEVIGQVKKDLPYYTTTGGGVTLSGGEPLAQSEFAARILQGCRAAGIHTAVETAGNVPWEAFERTLPVTDLYLFDYKLSSADAMKRYTCGRQERILKNLAGAAKYYEREAGSHGGKGKERGIWLRCPVIPGINDTKEHFAAIRALKARYPAIRKAEIMPYHEMGKNKWEQLGMEYRLGETAVPDPETVKEWTRQLSE